MRGQTRDIQGPTSISARPNDQAYEFYRDASLIPFTLQSVTRNSVREQTARLFLSDHTYMTFLKGSMIPLLGISADGSLCSFWQILAFELITEIANFVMTKSPLHEDCLELEIANSSCTRCTSCNFGCH